MSYRKAHIGPKIKHLRKRTPLLRRPAFWLCSCTGIFLAAIAYAAVFLPAFQVKQIEITGNNQIASGDIQGVAWQAVQKNLLPAGLFELQTKSIFLASSQSVHKKIIGVFPEVREVNVQKKLPDRITVTLSEREAVATFCALQNANEMCALIDREGIIFRPTYEAHNGMIIRNFADERQMTLGKNVVSGEYINYVLGIRQSLAERFGIQASEALIQNPLVITTSEGWRAYFDPAQDIALQVTKLEYLLQDTIKPEDRKNLQYIYLQYKNRAYYK